MTSAKLSFTRAVHSLPESCSQHSLRVVAVSCTQGMRSASILCLKPLFDQTLCPLCAQGAAMQGSPCNACKSTIHCIHAPGLVEGSQYHTKKLPLPTPFATPRLPLLHRGASFNDFTFGAFWHARAERKANQAALLCPQT